MARGRLGHHHASAEARHPARQTHRIPNCRQLPHAQENQQDPQSAERKNPNRLHRRRERILPRCSRFAASLQI